VHFPSAGVVHFPSAGATADIYSLGATLYSILALRAPISGQDTGVMLRRVLVGDITPPSEFNNLERRERDKDTPHSFPQCPESRIPAALSDIAMRAMAKDPRNRHAAVQELQADVEAYQKGEIWHLVLDQDFSGAGALAQWQVVGGQHEIRNGELHLSQGEPQILLFRRDLPGDVRIELEARQDGVYLNSIGCFLSGVHSANPKEIALNGYKFEYGAFDNSMNMIERAGCRIAGEPVSALRRGVTYRIRAERIGNRIKMSVNDREILSVIDADPLSGADHTACGLFGWLAETVFTRVRIFTLGTPWKSDILDIAERQIHKGNYTVAMILLQEVMDSFPDPARLERAQKARERARRREEMMKELEAWKTRLCAVWPRAAFDLRLTGYGYSLELSNADVEDLGPLRGIPLTSLVVTHNRIRSLEPLRGMPVTSLNIIGNDVEDIEPLRGMKLNIFVSEGCPIRSIEPLRGMPITLVNIGGGLVEDLEPLRGMPLTFLSCWGNKIRSLEPLAGMRTLAALYCNANKIESLEPLRGVPIVTMNCSGNLIRDLGPLQGSPLGVLHAGDNRIESLEPLRGCPLHMLSIQNNRIRSLDPLRGMDLASLTCGSNELKDFRALIDTPPDDFRYDGDSIPMRELERVRDRWARHSKFGGHLKQIAVLIALRRSNAKKLRQIATGFRGHRYLFIPKFLTWDEAKAYCEDLGGHLLTIPDKEANDFISSLFPQGAWFWMGLYRKPSGCEWVTGAPFTFTNFVDPLQARKPGPKIYSGRWTTDDVPGAHNSFVIEWDD